MNEPNDESDDLVSLLGQLQPAKAMLDSRTLMYRAGYEACRQELVTRRARSRGLAVAASLLVMIGAGSTGFLIGRSNAGNGSATTIARSKIPAVVDASAATTGDRDRDPLRNPPHVAVESSSGGAGGVDRSEKVTDADERVSSQRTAIDQRLAGWIRPLATIAKSTRLDRQSEKTLSTSHASLFLLDNALGRRNEFPLSRTSLSELQMNAASGTESPESSTDNLRRTLAAGDLSTMAIDMGTSR